MKKKTLAILSAVMVLAMSSMTVLAEEDADGTVVVNTSSTAEEYAAKTSLVGGNFEESISAVSPGTLNDVNNLIYNWLSSRPTEFWIYLDDEPTVPAAASELVAAASNPAAQVTGTIITVVDITSPQELWGGIEEYRHTLNVDGISAGDTIVVSGRHAWEENYWTIISYETATTDNLVSFPNSTCFGGPEFDYQTIAVVKVTVSDAAAGAATATDTTGVAATGAAADTTGTSADATGAPADATDAPAADTTAVDAPAAEASAADTAQTPSPQTGETVPMAAVILMVGLTGAVICGKKVFV